MRRRRITLWKNPFFLNFVLISLKIKTHQSLTSLKTWIVYYTFFENIAYAALNKQTKALWKTCVYFREIANKKRSIVLFFNSLNYHIFFHIQTGAKKSFKNSQGIKFYRFYFTAMPIIWQKTRCYRARSRMLRIFAYFKGKWQKIHLFVEYVKY